MQEEITWHHYHDQDKKLPFQSGGMDNAVHMMIIGDLINDLVCCMIAKNILNALKSS